MVDNKQFYVSILHSLAYYSRDKVQKVTTLYCKTRNLQKNISPRVIFDSMWPFKSKINEKSLRNKNLNQKRVFQAMIGKTL